MQSRLVTDMELSRINVAECGEKLVNIADVDSQIVIDMEEVSKSELSLRDNVCYVRKSVADRLKNVRLSLPNNLTLKLVDGYRPLSAQRKIYNQVFNEIKVKNRRFSHSRLVKETDKFVGNPDKIIPPHTTGGALDLTLVDKKGKELDMGAKINSISKNARTCSPDISKKASANRSILIKHMQIFGFVNYPLEWWHWSYGDNYWAAVNRTKAKYGALDVKL